MSDKKYQKEIEEILRNAGESAPDEAVRELEKPLEDRPRGQQRATDPVSAPYTPSSRWPTITPSKVLLAGLIIFIIAALLKFWTIMWLGLAVLVVGYLLFFVSPRSISMDKRWRGRPLEPGAESTWERLKRWMKN
jgi:Flp pilus assembly protein TadB